MKFSQVAAGTRAEQKATFVHGKREDGSPAEHAILLRPLSQSEEIDCEAEAMGASKLKGGKGERGEPIYEATRMMAVIARAVLDPESPVDKREAFFDLGIRQIGGLDPDTIARLHQLQQAWQEECSPSFRHKTTADLLALAHTLSEDEHDPLACARLSQKTQWTLLPFMARLLRDSPVFKSFFGSSSETLPASAASAAPEPPRSSPKASSSSPTESQEKLPPPPETTP